MLFFINKQFFLFKYNTYKKFIIHSCAVLISNKLCTGKRNYSTFYATSSIGIPINHVHIFEGRDDEGNRVAYTYYISKKQAIGLHTDFIIEKFEVEKNLESGEDKETVERSYPIAAALIGIFGTFSYDIKRSAYDSWEQDQELQRILDELTNINQYQIV